MIGVKRNSESAVRAIGGKIKRPGWKNRDDASGIDLLCPLADAPCERRDQPESARADDPVTVR